MSKSVRGSLSIFQKVSLYFFKRPRKTALIALVIVLFGAVSYTTLLKREGFPDIQAPIALGQGTYLAQDPAVVDKKVSEPLSEYILKQDGVKSVTAQSLDNFYTIVVTYKEKVDATKRTEEIQKGIKNDKILPASANIKFVPFKLGFTLRGDDLVISFYDKNGQKSLQDLTEQAKKASDYLSKQNLDLVNKISIINPYETAINPATNQSVQKQKSFERYGDRSDGQTKFHTAVVIGVDAKDGIDNIKLYDEVQSAINKMQKKSEFKDYQATISASNKPQIDQQISELQTSLLEGLIAILVVGSLVIAIRASVITVIAMFMVIAAVNGLLFIAGYTLNTITLFGMVLALSLIVDDTIIMVEAIDARRRKSKDPDEIVTTATKKVSQAMIAATSTAALSFTPLLFVGGILGTFLRAVPFTIISALVLSLFVALIFIPFFARFLLLSKNQLGKKSKQSSIGTFEEKVAAFISAPMLKARDSKKKLFGVGIAAILIGGSFIAFGGFMFTKVTFNIFPSSKDTNSINVVTTFLPGTSTEKAEQITHKIDNIVANTLGSNLHSAGHFGKADDTSATLRVDLIDYKERDVKSPELISRLEKSLKKFDEASVQVSQLDIGPPTSNFAARIATTDDRTAATELAEDVKTYLKQADLRRADGSQAKIESVNVANPSIFTRYENKPYIQVTAVFEDSDTTTLVSLAKSAVEKHFSYEKVKSYGLKPSDLSYDFGQESDNQDSFATMILAFPIVLAVIYILLVFQFRSFMQPLLIFMAIPFSLFGITLGLYYTDNSFSFFAMLGFFALIGLSIKNTILLTDYANQARARGEHPVDAAHEALAERFRPLIATSLTAVVSLIPLTITSPFWEGLGVVLIFGLLSSTLLVVTVFPYYYLGVEYLRIVFQKRVSLPVKQLIVEQLHK